MRVIVVGAGAVGSVLAARLHQGGADVVMVGRAAHVAAINERGLRVRTAEEETRVAVRALTSLAELRPGRDDAVLITAKTQDTAPIHDAVLRWNRDVAVVCGTNGVEHERLALRRFDRVYGMVVQLPATYEQPGVVTALCLPTNALVDVGCYPAGTDDTAHALAEVMAASPHVSCEADPAVMTKKAAKLLVNLTNASEAVCGPGGRFHPVSKAAMREGRRVFAAAGVAFELPAELDGRYKERLASMQFAIPEGDTFIGGSTWQGLAKAAGTTETDYFNGEIVLLGRLHGIPTPHNEFLQRLVSQHALAAVPPGTLTAEQLEAAWLAATGGNDTEGNDMESNDTEGNDTEGNDTEGNDTEEAR